MPDPVGAAARLTGLIDRRGLVDPSGPEGVRNLIVARALEEIQSEITRLADMIQAPVDLLPTYGYSRDAGYPHIEIDGALMSYVIRERGQDVKRDSSVDLEDILYWTFSSVTFSMASALELRNRVDGQDFRPLLWTKQFELLDRLNPAWTQRRRKDLGPLPEEVGM